MQKIITNILLFFILIFISNIVSASNYRKICDIKKSTDAQIKIRIQSAEDACLGKRNCHAGNYEAIIVDGDRKGETIWFTTVSNTIKVGYFYLIFPKKINTDKKIFYDKKLFYTVPDKVNYFLNIDAVFSGDYRFITNGCVGSPDCDMFPKGWDANKIPVANVIYPHFKEELKNCE